MDVKLLHISPKWVMVEGIRTCWKSDHLADSDKENDILGPNDQKTVRNVLKHGHESTLEHSQITFEVSGVSRALLQELSRHRVGTSPSVESTRYTMKRILRNEVSVNDVLVKTGNELIDKLNHEHMTKLKALLNTFDIPQDIAKYGLVEAYQVKEIVTFNIRSLRNFLRLRLTDHALWEIKELATQLFLTLPHDYDIFFEDIMEEFDIKRI